jgi:3',5'-cyclic AMP phosphodiesterase CpdA
MEITINKVAVLLILSLIFSSCKKFELRGFVTSYESAEERFDMSMDWNTDHPFRELIVPADNYSIYVMGDSHLGDTINLNLFLKKAIKMKAVAAVMDGDLTNGHSEDYQSFQKLVNENDSLISFKILGNHDLYFDGWKQFYPRFGSSTYYFSVKTPASSDLFICLDSGNGTLGRKQLHWLKNILETERSKYRHCVLFTHINFWMIRHTISANLSVEELRVLMELCIEHKVEMVISGHDHEKNVVEFGNTTYITLDALQDDFADAGYLVLSSKDGNINYEFVNLGH